MDNCALTENMTSWLTDLYLNAADEEKRHASHCHLIALGSETQEESIQWETNADEHREFAHILECLAKELIMCD